MKSFIFNSEISIFDGFHYSIRVLYDFSLVVILLPRPQIELSFLGNNNRLIVSSFGKTCSPTEGKKSFKFRFDLIFEKGEFSLLSSLSPFTPGQRRTHMQYFFRSVLQLGHDYLFFHMKLNESLTGSLLYERKTMMY